MSPKGVLQRSGSVGLSLIIWMGSGLISLLGMNSNDYTFGLTKIIVITIDV